MTYKGMVGVKPVVLKTMLPEYLETDISNLGSEYDIVDLKYFMEYDPSQRHMLYSALVLVKERK